jgi:transketolase
MDAVQQANSGHPGAPMGMADIAEVLWRGFLKHNPANPHWWNRDRFILSNGHGSMLLYSLLHLTGYPVGMQELRDFRQLGSRTAGHPEHDVAMGIETTTGPLGQGFANAVGFALAEKILAAQFNRDGLAIVDHHTWVFLGDGCLMEGVSHEAASLAGTLGLGKLICLYDDNGISIDGKVQGWFTDDTPKRFESYGWQVIPNVDGHDGDEVAIAIRTALAETDRPTLICCKTVIGWPAPTRGGTSKAHGEPLGVEEVAAVRARLGWSLPPFEVPETLRALWNCQEAGRKAEAQWQAVFARYQRAFPQLAAEFERRMSGDLPANWDEIRAQTIAAAAATSGAQATRVSSQTALNALGPALPELLGGSADLTGSNNTLRKDSRTITRADASGNYLYYGVREFGMTAVMNGLALHGGLIPYAGTFLTFSDYARNAVRMAALMRQRVVLVYTHDPTQRDVVRRPPRGPPASAQPARAARLMPSSARALAHERIIRPRFTHQDARRHPPAPDLPRFIVRPVIRSASDHTGRSVWPSAVRRRGAGPRGWCRCRAPMCSMLRMRPGVSRYCRRPSRAGSRSRPAPRACGGGMSAVPGGWWASTSLVHPARPATCFGNSA